MLSNRRDIRQYIYVLDNIIRPFFYLFSLSLLKGKPIDFALLFFSFLCVTRTVVGPAGWAT